MFPGIMSRRRKSSVARADFGDDSGDGGLERSTGSLRYSMTRSTGEDGLMMGLERKSTIETTKEEGGAQNSENGQ